MDPLFLTLKRRYIRPLRTIEMAKMDLKGPKNGSLRTEK
jgi:hypothetical protein